MTEPTKPVVTQADESAARAYLHYGPCPYRDGVTVEPTNMAEHREVSNLAEAFAKHRLAHTPPVASSQDLEPVAWMQKHPDHLTELELDRHGAGRLTDGDKADGWTEEPLYGPEAAERIKSLQAEVERLTADWFKGHVDCDGNELVTIRADELQKLRDEREGQIPHPTDSAAKDAEIANQGAWEQVGFYKEKLRHAEQCLEEAKDANVKLVREKQALQAALANRGEAGE